MSYKDKYIRRNQAYESNSLKETYVNNSKRVISYGFKDNPSATWVSLNDSEEETCVWIVEDTKNPEIKKIIMQPDDMINAGWIVHWKDNTWLCTVSDKSKDVYETGFIEKCNSELKWIDENGEIHSYPSVFYYGAKANFGTFSDKVMTLPDGRRQIVVQKNEHTAKLKRDRRFIFGDSVFKVIDSDYISSEGIVNLNLKDDLFNPATDNMELGIADYYESDDESDDDTPITDGYVIEIKSTSSTPNEIRRNQSKEYYCEVHYDSQPIEDKSITFELFADDQISETDLAYIEEETNTNCVIRNNGATSGYVWLKATLEEDENIVDWIKIQMKSIF